MNIRRVKDLEAYRCAFEFQQQVFVVSKKWPRDETYSLTDQIRRSSRSIGSNLAEAWAKRRYPAHFLSKLTDSGGELQESIHWLDTAQACEYLGMDDHTKLLQAAETLGRLLGGIMAKHETFCLR